MNNEPGMSQPFTDSEHILTPNFTNSKNMIGVKFKNVSVTFDQAHYG